MTAIKKTKMEPIPCHFNSNNHTCTDLGIIGIENIKAKDIHLRKIRESFWIGKLNTIQPHGLNQNNGVGDQMRML